MIEFLKQYYGNDLVQLKDVSLVYANKESNIVPHCFLNYYNFCLIKKDFNWLLAGTAKRFDGILTLFNQFENALLPILENALTKPQIQYENAFLISFFVANVGHSMSPVLKAISYYKRLNLMTTVLVYDDILSYNNFFKSILFLFFQPEQVTFIKPFTNIFCQNLTMVETPVDWRTEEAENFLLSEIHKNVIGFKFNCELNLCLIKSENTINSLNERKFDHSWTQYFEEKKFMIVKPEDMDVISLYKLLNSAKNIVLSWGCNSYMNSFLIENPRANTLVLCHRGYKNEYTPLLIQNETSFCDMTKAEFFPKHGNTRYLLDLNETITEQNKLDVEQMIW